jgi:hypothetical protein
MAAARNEVLELFLAGKADVAGTNLAVVLAPRPPSKTLSPPTP